jgi:hypothetical protein
MLRPGTTPEERAILEIVARRKGWEWVDHHRDLILDQARLVGELPPAEGSNGFVEYSTIGLSRREGSPLPRLGLDTHVDDDVLP